MDSCVVIDIETAPMPNLPEPSEEWLNRGMGNRVKPEAVEAKRCENRLAWTERAALDWRLGQVIAVGKWFTGDSGPTITHADPLTEREVLEAFWSDLAGARHVVGFNIRSFDLPFLIGRSAINGLVPCRRFNRARFRTDLGVIDWCEILSDWGGFDMTGWSLSQYAKHFGLHVPIGDGAEVPAAWAEGRYEYIIEHLKSDLLSCLDLHEMFAPAFL